MKVGCAWLEQGYILEVACGIQLAQDEGYLPRYVAERLHVDTVPTR